MMEIDEERADRAIKFVRNLRHVKGRWSGKPFQLLQWQESLMRQLFGSVDPETGFRRYRTCYVSTAKKSGKSELAAAVALILLCADDEEGAEVYGAAADREQASIVFNVASKMVRQNKVLSKRLKIRESVKRIVDHRTGSFYHVLSSEAYSKHGFNISGLIIDELHAIKDREFVDVLTQGAGDARTQSLTFIITTAGYDRQSICWEYHQRAVNALQDPEVDPTFLPLLYTVPESADWEDRSLWHLANPSLGQIFDFDKLVDAYNEAKSRPALQNVFRRLRLNQWVQQAVRWLDMSRWDLCGDPVNLTKGRTCYAAMDLSSSIDITAVALIFPPEDGEGRYELLPFFFIPEDRMTERSKRDKVPYDVWVRQKLMTATPGNVVDQEFIKAKILDLAAFYDVKEVAYDRWGAVKLSTELAEKGLTMVPMGQGFASMSAPTKEFETLILQGRLAHGGNPVLRWMANNTAVKQDPAGNLKPDKGKSTEKIDGIVASIMALDRALRNQRSQCPYDTRGVVAI